MLNNETAVVNTEPWGIVCTAMCWIQYLLAINGCQCVLPMGLRSRIRAKYNIVDESTMCFPYWPLAMDDCCVSFWCLPCAAVQEYKTLKAYTVGEPIGPKSKEMLFEKV